MRPTVLCSCLAAAIVAGGAFAAPYRITFSGTIDSAEDNRVVGNDPFVGTDLDLGVYSPQVGHAWSYSLEYDQSDFSPGVIMPDGGSPHAIYDGPIGWTLTLDGRAVSGGSGAIYFTGNASRPQAVEFWNTILPAGNADAVTPFLSFRRTDGLNELINGGYLPTHADMFDRLDFGGFVLFGDNGIMEARSEACSVTVEQVPAPASGVALVVGVLFGSRRRRV